MPAIIRSIRFPDLLMQALEVRAKQLGYASFNSYMLGLVIYDLICQGMHSITLPIAKATGHQKDRVYSWLLRVVGRGVGVRGVLLSHIVERAQKKHQTELEAILEMASEEGEEWSHYAI